MTTKSNIRELPVEVITLADRVCAEIVTAIVKGEIPSGQKISEPELARTYGISRGPLREAMRRLEGLRLIERKPNVGARVVQLSIKELVEIYHVREALEGMACRMAALHMSDEEIADLRSLLDEHERSVQELDGRSYFQKEGDLDFHYRIVQGSKNEKLLELLGSDLYHLVRMYRYQFSVSSSRPKRALKEHRQIVDAIEARDPELAELLMRRHISAARQNIENKLNLSSNIKGEIHG
ncbi:GntR family transcriptional regulator [Neptunomonas phycophila]|jgi:DNA-binding GntR family transcriptional regulator|uniref:GntR family transcriptional regulator n=1 Tax=Neptunomonas phycophila TaxID=1572645 RepID=A0AAW7XH79_9GAMM|nr:MULTISPECIES: GntR family transcriptional regulator [Neptunomonas]MBT3146131.1 GntR family transcriptional regulator [Neptunomonas phycophila]MDN2659710.1 GntR family transcriptional regulator [Neptunomonas sp. CHC150]MDO6452235.1 GntR family transcriptional regulator [Neptunomonas phycophila]MDO6466843.1 GntR family transcriptional regulator [Neptunomonas phycophila]MDO6783199.1 GntR family transcriptional regulator [Neptunomonas phycophila]